MDRATIDATVHDVNRAHDRARLAGALAIGDVAIAGLFGGDRARVTGRGRRSVGFRRFAEHARLQVSAQRVWEGVRLRLMVDSLPDESREALSFPQLRAMLGAADAPGLAKVAIEEGLSPARIAAVVAAEALPRRGGGAAAAACDRAFGR